ncbi:hypothetical protein ACG7TL_001166 [Trametes sanguinea]
MYVGLREGLNNLLCSINADEPKQLTAYITPECAPGDGNGFDVKPNLILYPRYAVDSLKAPLEDQHNDAAEGQFTKAKIPCALAEIVVDAQISEELCAFPYLASSWESLDEDTTSSHKKARDRLMRYADELLVRQHRAFVPVIYVFRDEARCAAVDHSGAQISAPFKYATDLTPLAAFLRRYVAANPQGRGFDPTASLAPEADHEAFSGDTWVASYLLRIARLPVSTPSAPPHNANIPAGEYLIGRPQFRSRSIIGSATRCYAAWDHAKQRPVFIKDYWRLNRGLSEHQIYVKFSQGPHPVTNIPTIVGGGDVYSVDFGCQTTRTRMISTLDGDIFVGERVHTRLVMKEIGRPLESFKDWRELASIVNDALKAHQMAWVHHNVLHRDLSVGNILIHDSDGKSEAVGLLSDWDLAKTKEEVLDPRPSQKFRSGTWQFMSAAIQRWPQKPHSLSDDLESVMHILNWLVLKYMKTEAYGDPSDLADYVSMIYDYAGKNTNSCSLFKYRMVSEGSSFAMLPSEYKDHPFIGLLDRLRELCASQYRLLNPSLPTDEYLAACREGPVTAPLNTHDAMLDAFKEALDNPTWPHIPKLQDQLKAFLPSSSYVPGKRQGDSSLDADREAKRRPTGTPSGKTKTSADVDPAQSGSASTSAGMAPLGNQSAKPRTSSRKPGTGERKK